MKKKPVPTSKQVDEWAHKTSTLLRLVGDEVSEQDLFEYLEIPEEYREWAKAYLQYETCCRTETLNNLVYWKYRRGMIYYYSYTKVTQ